MRNRRATADLATRRALLAGLASLGCLAVRPARAALAGCADLAGAKLRFIVPHTASGGYDTYTRLLQPFLERHVGARIVVENVSGAGGLVGAVAIRDAAPDGRTLGILNASGLIAAGLDQAVPDPARDYTVLGRLLSNRTVLATGSRSGLRTIDELLVASTRRPIVVGVRDAGSASMFVVPVVASLVGLRYELVTGYEGNSARALAAIRGEVDLLVQNFDSVQRFIADGELRPLLQVAVPSPTTRASGSEKLLDGVPLLGGAAGVAQRRAAVTGRTREQAIAQAQSLDDLLDAGRLIVAPARLPAAAATCLGSALSTTLADPGFVSAARRAQLTIEPAGPPAALAALRKAEGALRQFAPLVRAAMHKART